MLNQDEDDPSPSWQNMPIETVEPRPKRTGKKGFLPGIWSAKDGPGPAAWRCDNTAIRGQVRRKGERDPMNGGLRMTRAMAETRRWREVGPLPPLSKEVRVRNERVRARREERERERREGEGGKRVEGEKKGKGKGKGKGKKDDGCAVM
ncbi:hypothetical protein L207DRAFT_591210 [Hyaloscypha variabilis F]|uniref:Uncharacterized protein n=1 Tax=Hyaloscypha variabilis (strain UAMH 11265 / GT02V1 / F) TaxID=1149755 RepID=A0A2J6QZU2_HYAVF|nr:hypothetical protein L207DRAFT_591210 [Hyaloscypha variabilis F]